MAHRKHTSRQISVFTLLEDSTYIASKILHSNKCGISLSLFKCYFLYTIRGGVKELYNLDTHPSFGEKLCWFTFNGNLYI